MTPWLALSLGLWLGQTPEITPSLPPDATTDTAATGTGGAGTEGTPDNAQAQGAEAPDTGNTTASAINNLQQQVDALQSEVQALQAQITLQQQRAALIRERAQTLERERQGRLDELERARQGLIAADQALAVGQLDIGDTLQGADAALAQVLQSATDTGNGQTVRLVEDARNRIAQAISSTGNRDTYNARWDLFFAYEDLREARRHNLDEPSATTVIR